MDGHGVIKAYQDNLNANGHGYTWFSTDSLNHGMAKAKADEYNSRIQNGAKVIMLFAVADEQNDICYTAEVLAVHTSKFPVDCPDGNTACVPVEFNGEDRARKIWIKLTNIQRETTLKADMFRIISTGANLKQVISNSQYHFGYVCLIDDDATKTEIPF